MKKLLLAAAMIMSAGISNASEWEKRSSIDDFTGNVSEYYVAYGKGKASYSKTTDSYGSILLVSAGGAILLQTLGFYACGDSISNPDTQLIQVKFNDGEIYKMSTRRVESSFSYSIFGITNSNLAAMIERELKDGGKFSYRIDQTCLTSKQRYDGTIFVEGKFPYIK